MIGFKLIFLQVLEFNLIFPYKHFLILFTLLPFLILIQLTSHLKSINLNLTHYYYLIKVHFPFLNPRLIHFFNLNHQSFILLINSMYLNLQIIIKFVFQNYLNLFLIHFLLKKANFKDV